MAFVLQLSSLSTNDKKIILDNFTARSAPTQYVPVPQMYKCFKVDRENDDIYLPIGSWPDYSDSHPNGKAKDFWQMNKNAKFVGKLLTKDTDHRKRDQDMVVCEALHRLNTRGTVFLALFTGMGKTALSVYLSIELKCKTVILCHLDAVKRQWPEEYAKFSGNTVKVQCVKDKKGLDPTADVYVIGVKKACLMNTSEFANIGTVIVDEAHIASVSVFTEALFKFRPRYLIGLSATPDKATFPLKMFDLYFGCQKDFIVREEIKPFTVIKVDTPFKPTIKFNTIGNKTTLCWTTVVNSLDGNPVYWELVAQIAINHPKEKIAVMCDRKALSTGVYNILKRRGESVTIFAGNVKKLDVSARILVISLKKGGTGLNDPTLTMAIIASNTKDVRQYEGRIRTTDNIIYHVVHNYSTLENHYKECATWYYRKGAEFEYKTSLDIFIDGYWKVSATLSRALSERHGVPLDISRYILRLFYLQFRDYIVSAQKRGARPKTDLEWINFIRNRPELTNDKLM